MDQPAILVGYDGVMEITDRISIAEALLPGAPAPDGECDPRWQAIIAIGKYVESDPQEVWQFVARWGTTEDQDLQSAIATCLLEHLLEDHFELLFPRVDALAKSDRNFANTFLGCWKLGQANLPGNSERFDELTDQCSTAEG